ncbi:ISNCY family transposase ISRor2 [Sodalis praecaptivus]|uniref:Rpn family recombination-promoting nuclease/putative transposase n=1 Tax=Sodalis praecaptivus TaxID=1239307 RepID=UPI0027E70130|nr:Rpn family recombination-promoting nuclease/putative transposase [Sodalis praecaptivus]CAJ0995241.1 ISNCY family transposase ISRor2 [Sodalis praecaptivus]
MNSSLSHRDALFKQFLADKEVARDFFNIHLPPEMKNRCDFATLNVVSGSFIDDALRSLYSEMVYSVRTSEGEGYIYCLIEHQSRPEKHMPLRLYRYSLAVMKRYLEQSHQALPVVIPMLFYHGRTSPYPWSTRWLDCFADPELAESVYTQPFPLIDVTAMSDDEILTHKRVALLELVQKHIRTRDMLALAGKLAGLMNTWSLSLEQFRGLMFYIAEWGNVNDVERFLKEIALQISDYKEEVMTIADQLRQQGVEKGIQQGRCEAKIELVHRLLANGADFALIKSATDLSDEELTRLKDLQ